jgi:hypothetical protein
MMSSKGLHDFLHIRCGSDLAQPLQKAGLPGAYLAWVDPVCDGPTPEGLTDETYRATRARFIADRYGEILAAVLGQLIDQDRALARADDFAEAVIWVEHDLFDQSILIRLLAWFADHPHRALSLVQSDDFLGRQTPEALTRLFAARRRVTVSELKLGGYLWELWCAPDPRPLEALATILDDPARRPEGVSLPHLPAAIRRHLANLPGTRDGLSMTERLALRAVADGAETAAAIFASVCLQEPAAWLGDMMFYPVLRDLSHPPFALLEQADDRYRLTPIGGAVVMGQMDALQFGSQPRWIGGCVLDVPPQFRWDQQEERVVEVQNLG